jgi:TRAP-type C4-dicarboxylate transport system permease small subunit
MADAVFEEEHKVYGPVGRVLDVLSRVLAVGSGVVLTGMAVISLASVVGRAVFDYPVLGDYELVQMLSAAAVAMALPFCQMVRGNVIVDFFTTGLPAEVNRFFDLCANLLLTIGAFAFAWRMTVGLIELRRTGDASMLLNLPTWWTYIPMVLSFTLLGCVSLYSAWEDFTGERK